jgi:hypothetical protein
MIKYENQKAIVKQTAIIIQCDHQIITKTGHGSCSHPQIKICIPMNDRESKAP